MRPLNTVYNHRRRYNISNMTSISPNPLFQDLKVTFQPSTLVLPSQQTEKKSIYLSNIDQMLSYDLKVAHIFPANPNFPPEIVAKRLKMALSKVLVPYDFMAGRMRFNHHTGRREINCNAAGVGFMMASSEYTLDEIGDLATPNLGFHQLAMQSLDNTPDDDQPLCNFQVTSFKCGGYAIGTWNNHVLLDGIAAKIFLDNLASQAFEDNRPLAVVPYHNRRLLAARSPPHVAFQHPELVKPDHLPTLGASVFHSETEELEHIVFKLSSDNIKFLMEKAKSGMNINTNTKRISDFTLVAALMWRCKALSSPCDIRDKISTLLSVIDLRRRLSPRLPKSYSGNALLVASSSAEVIEIEKGLFGKLVELVLEAPKRVTDEYARSMIDWIEINKGIFCGDYAVTSWLGLGFERVVYPWGSPIHSRPVSYKKEACRLFPGVNGTIHALVSLPAGEMAKFQFHFHKFFDADSNSKIDE